MVAGEGCGVYFCGRKKLMIMSTPVMTWSVVAGLMAIVGIVRMAMGIWHGLNGRGHRLIELGSEREEFFVPGDQTGTDDMNDEGEYV